ncbi:hypothetical protein [Winogradskyella helgolandensis]|uniref:hypothetical protein n=1 Tax=Winogradskyella helgolandensis TaxID=2697010 RepID=UPI0015BAB556|nr:hypothetical protein [Winogradskyella helgolandensis]
MTNTQYILLALFCLFVFNGFSQTQIDTTKRVYVPLKTFKEKFKSKDSIGFFVDKHKDTLIRINNYEAPKGIAVPYEYKDSTFLQQYEKVAFKIKHKDSADTHTMKYWKDDIKIFFSERIPRNVVKNIMIFTNRIDSEVDSLHIYQVKHLEQSNYVIYTDKDYQYLNGLKHYKRSEAWTYWNHKNQIDRVYLRLYSPEIITEKLQSQMIKNLFFNTLGYFNLDNELGCENYLSNCYSADNKQLTTLDLEILKYHYSYGICKGTTRNTFREQHRQCKEALNKSNALSLFYHN